jgi:hypothetical protein
VLELFPQIELEALEWKTGRAEAPGAKPGATPLGAAKPAAGGETAIVLELSGRVNATQRDDYRGITAQVQQFAETLAATSGYERLRMQLPFDITSEGTLTGDIGERGSGDAPRFTVVLAGRLP